MGGLLCWFLACGGSRKLDTDGPRFGEDRWSATQEQVYPTSARMRKYFTSDAYLNRVNKAREFYAGKFWVDFGNEGVQRDVKAAMGWGALEVGGA